MPLISIITDKKNRITKEFSLDPDGNLQKVAAEHLDDGTIETLNLTPTELLTYVKSMTQHQCLCLGMTPEPGVHTIKSSFKALPEDLTRTKTDLVFSTEFPHYLLLDFDDAGVTPQGALDILAAIDPQLSEAGGVILPSSSSYIYREDWTELIGVGNFHIYLEVSGDPSEYGRTLFRRLILNGRGKPFLTKNGTVKIKTLFDSSVLSPEREIFVAQPVLHDGLRSDRFIHASASEGKAIDTNLLPPLTKEEEVKLYFIESQLRESVSDMSEKLRAEYNEQRAVKRARSKGTNKLMELAAINDAAITYDRLGRPIQELLSSEEIMDQDGSMILVADLLINPEDGRRLPDITDPYTRGDEARGIPGKGIATVLGNMIYSHAAGGQIFLIRWDVEDLLRIFDRANDIYDDAVRAFIWKAVTSGVQQISSMADEGMMNELAEMVKVSMKGKGVGTDKKQIMNKIKLAARPAQPELDDPIVKFNARYGMANMGGKAVVISEEWSEQGQVFEIQYNQPIHLDTLTKNDPIIVPGVPGGKISMYRYWEQHKDRNTYEGVDFCPSGVSFRKPGERRVIQQGGTYNLWQGYIMDPGRATSCEKIKSHLKNIWCSGIEKEYAYVFAWLARLFQKPGEVSTTALVLQSKQGAGKSMIIDKILVETFGVHGISTANRDDVVGRFNLHLGLNCFLYANELAYSAEASSKSLLKTLLTDEHRTIEAKNVNKIKARNYSSVIFSSNDYWMLPVEVGDRRFVYLTVSNEKLGDRKYFSELLHEIENGGREAFVLWLLNYDYSKVNLREIPNPTHKQKVSDLLRTMHPAVQFVYTMVDPDSDLNMCVNSNFYSRVKTWRDGGAELELTKGEFFDLYKEYSEYFKINRQYDNLTNILVHLESGGIINSDPATDQSKVVATIETRKRKNTIVFKPINKCRGILSLEP